MQPAVNTFQKLLRGTHWLYCLEFQRKCIFKQFLIKELGIFDCIVWPVPEDPGQAQKGKIPGLFVRCRCDDSN